MGHVVSFESPERTTRRPRRSRGEPLGQILLFTGVRYERTVEPSRPHSDPDGRSRRRRRGG
jgi:hypothetical protein